MYFNGIYQFLRFEGKKRKLSAGACHRSKHEHCNFLWRLRDLVRAHHSISLVGLDWLVFDWVEEVGRRKEGYAVGLNSLVPESVKRELSQRRLQRLDSLGEPGSVPILFSGSPTASGQHFRSFLSTSS